MAELRNTCKETGGIPMSKVLEVKDLVTTFRIGKEDYEVLRGISFDINENETL